MLRPNRVTETENSISIAIKDLQFLLTFIVLYKFRGSYKNMPYSTLFFKAE